MKKIKLSLTKNWGFKLISLAAAVILWLVVINITDPVETKKIEVPITIVNENAITDQNMIYSITSVQSATVSVNVRKTEYSKVTSATFKATVDLNKWYPGVSAVPVDIELVDSRYVSDSDWTQKTTVIQINTEDIDTKTFELNVEVEGSPASGYTFGEATASVKQVTVSAPVSTLENLSRAVVKVDGSGISRTEEIEAEIIIYNEGGGKVEASETKHISFSDTKATVTVNVLKTNTVPISVANVTGTPAEGFKFTEAQLSRTEVKVAGMKSAMAALTSIVLTDTKLNVQGATEDVVVKLDISKYLPDDTYLYDSDDSSVTVTLKVEKLSTKSFAIDASKLNVTGQNTALSYTFENIDDAQIVITGLEDDLRTLSYSSLAPTVSVEGLGVGTYTVVPAVTLGKGYTLDSIGSVTVIVSSVSAETESSTTASGN